MSEVKHGFTVDAIIEEGRISMEEINSVKIRLSTSNIKLTDEQVVLFSLSCRNDLEATISTIKSFYSTRNAYPALFTNRKVDLIELQQQLEALEFCIFPKRTSDGCAIIFHRLYDTNFLHYNMEPAVKVFFMTLDAAIRDHPPQGLIVLFDMAGVGLLHLTRVQLGMVRVFFHYLQECIPLRLRAIHVLNSVYFLEKVISIIKPFIKKEVMDMVHFHPCNLDMRVFNERYLPKECLPEEFGGCLESVRVLHQKNTKKLVAMETYFEAEENQRSAML